MLQDYPRNLSRVEWWAVWRLKATSYGSYGQKLKTGRKKLRPTLMRIWQTSSTLKSYIHFGCNTLLRMSHRLEIHFSLTFPCDWAVPLKDGSDSQCIWTEVKWQEMLDPLESLFPFLVFDRRLNFPHERKFLGKNPSLYIALFFQKCIHHFFKITFFWLFLCVFQIKRGEVVSNTQLHQQFCMALQYTMQDNAELLMY